MPFRSLSHASACATLACFLLISPGNARLPPQNSASNATPTPQVSAVSVPDTPAGRQFTAMLQAVNTGKRETIRQFMAAHFAYPDALDRVTDHLFGLYQTTRGLDIRKVANSSPTGITVLMEAKETGVWLRFALFVSSDTPEFKIVGLGESNIAAPPELLPNHSLTNREIARRVDRLISQQVVSDRFSGTVVVAQSGKIIYKRACGLASRTWNIPNRVDTRFNLASITKMFTAVAIAQLVEQGKLSYSDTVGKILPDYPNSDVAQKVTIHQLLSHTSGMIGARDLAEKFPPRATMRTINEMIAPFAAEPLSFPPGQRFAYSNAGFILLGAIIEKVSGQSYYTYVRTHLFEPAGMHQTDFYELDRDPINIATGFADGPNGTRLNNIFDLGVIGSPAGGAYSNGEDMVRFQQALTRGVLLRPSSLTTVWTGVTGEEGSETTYGYGAQITHYNGARIVWHGGGWKGITNHFDMYPDLGYTVVILSNYDNDPQEIAFKLREWITQGKVSKTTAILPASPRP